MDGHEQPASLGGKRESRRYAAGRCPSALRKAGTGWRGPGTTVGGSDSGRVSVPSDHLSYSARWGNPPFARGGTSGGSRNTVPPPHPQTVTFKCMKFGTTRTPPRVGCPAKFGNPRRQALAKEVTENLMVIPAEF
ncbi:unnamed protein product [Pleuronectes platessa]|uniref:Uncharacterized protein n=1 Tax=Pleuronectes platessa TaxID=8262 RepID=A0A9N7TQP0_PLEPL|nr:unnamed protein product [Pleuronectes platessa]